jgi:hypothetical protein
VIAITQPAVWAAAALGAGPAIWLAAFATREAGRLICEGCAFDFAEAYGERGQGFMEAHHTRVRVFPQAGAGASASDSHRTIKSVS